MRPVTFPAMWWRDGVLYQVYPRSFRDHDGDGVGDLPGVMERLDHLAWLGVDGLWLNPTFPSPNVDWGFDVSDYRGVHRDFGTIEDLDRLVREAGRRGIRVLLDLVPNHSSDRHPWFEEARSSRDSPRRDWYVWADPAPDGGPPNNWLSTFGGPAWTLDERTAQYYLHNFAPQQPDLNWWNEDVRREFDDILRWWFRRGIAGFRIDVAHGIVKDRELRDNPPAEPADAEQGRQSGLRQEFSQNRPEVHEVFRRWRSLANAESPPRVLIGETWVLDLERMAAFYGADDELHLAFNFPFVTAPFDASRLSFVVEETERLVPPESWPVWMLSNHDLSRFPTRWAGGDPDKARLALMLLLTLRGTPVVYYGDEIAMPDTPAAAESGLDPQQLPLRPPRDPARTPMHWTPDRGAGFNDNGAEPWLPIGDNTKANVADQREDPSSPLNLVRDLIALRRANADLRSGAYRRLEARGAWAFLRGERLAVALNLSDEAVSLPGLRGRVLIGTDRSRDGSLVSQVLELRPWEGLVLVRSA
jgi:alpha-glucosidase